MNVVSVNVGTPQEVLWRGRRVRTGIFKSPVAGRVAVQRLNLDGDRQADLTAHGGLDKAVYAYPAEHYSWWRDTLARDLPWGSFGENLTLAGLPLEDDLCVGDRIRAGTALLEVTQPRLPCFKLGLRFGDPRMVKRFLAAGRSGYYLRVVEEGAVAAGDEADLVARHPAAVPVSEITRLYAHDRDDADGLRAVLAVDVLPEAWRPYFAGLLADAG